MKQLISIYICLFTSTLLFSQQLDIHKKKDTTATELDEIIVIGRRNLSNYGQEKTLSSIDDYLEKSNTITMIKRGNYAWEPSLNNMVTDRLSVTIDGMQIYGACTDKMDPVTSYVDVSNLEKVSINSGQEGAENANCIGGSIDLKIPDSKYRNSGLKSSFDLGYETNGNYKSTGLDLEYSGHKFYISADGIYRKSDNYSAGRHQEIQYSQFEKYNISLQTGYKLSEKHSIDANLIYDKATDIGYPALPMDVSLAEAIITSITHHYKSDSTALKSWETKMYFNTITHTMDDSKRPIVPIRMDMPGWSDTYGMYSKVKIDINKHHLSINLNSHYNRSLAEMTMYPNDPSENTMFMYTWPDIRTLYSGLYIKDELQLKPHKKISLSGRFGYHKNDIKNDIGLQSLRIFYPEMNDHKSRFLPSISSSYSYKHKNITYNFGLGYGERAPSISEGYGFYLFNSFDKYDYIGNPNLKNEKSLELNTKANYKHDKLNLHFETSYFRIYDYIIGEIDASLSPMTIGANGVRIYSSLNYASIFSSHISADYSFSKKISVSTSLGYNFGEGSNNKPLPLISPLSYFAELNYSLNQFNASIQIKGDGNQSKYSSHYGEDETPSYAVVNITLGNSFFIKNNRTVLKYGVENILDTQYSSYADWNNIPRQGRNFYLNVSYIIQ
jgi:iron complex outermembrane receptor protein